MIMEEGSGGGGECCCWGGVDGGIDVELTGRIDVVVVIVRTSVIYCIYVLGIFIFSIYIFLFMNFYKIFNIHHTGIPWLGYLNSS